MAEGRFEQARGLRDYQILLGEEFSKELATLGRKATWIDMGAGFGRAQIEYAQSRLGRATLFQSLFQGKARTIAVGYTDPTEILARWPMLRGLGVPPGSFKRLTGRYLEEIADAELGKADLITDVYGIFAYTEDLSGTLARYLNLLKRDGSIYVHSVEPRTTIRSADGNSQYSMIRWLYNIKGLEIEVLPLSFRIRKTQDHVEVPKLKLIDGMADRPARRIFVTES